jgi:thiamine monophosphate synthase
MAIGGITRERVAEVLAAGAHGVAVRGGIWNSGDPSFATRAYLKELEKGKRT